MKKPWWNQEFTFQPSQSASIPLHTAWETNRSWKPPEESYDPVATTENLNGLRRDRTGRRAKGDRTQLQHLTQTDPSNTSYHAQQKTSGTEGRQEGCSWLLHLFSQAWLGMLKFFFHFPRRLTFACWWEEGINFLFCLQLLLSILGWHYLHPQVFLPSFYLLCLERGEWVAVWVSHSYLSPTHHNFKKYLPFVWKSL